VKQQKIIVGVSVNNLSRHYQLKDLFRAAQEAEELGFDAIWLHDAPLGRRTMASWDPVAVLAALAKVTERVKLCTGIFQPHLRNPVAVAQSWATVDYLSGGRTIMGAGSGAGVSRLVQREYDALAVLRPGGVLNPQEIYRKRRRLFVESVEVIRRLWDEDHVTYHGEFYHLEDVTLGLARPVQKPHPPILIAAGNYYPTNPGGSVHHGWDPKRAGKFIPGPLESVAQIGDGWITSHPTPEEYGMALATIRSHAQKLGRDLSDFILAFNCFVNVNVDRGRAWEEARQHLNDFHGPPVPDDVVDRWAIVGKPDGIIQRLREFIAQGATLFQLVIGSPDQFGQMRLLAREVLPGLKGA